MTVVNTTSSPKNLIVVIKTISDWVIVISLPKNYYLRNFISKSASHKIFIRILVILTTY